MTEGIIKEKHHHQIEPKIITKSTLSPLAKSIEPVSLNLALSSSPTSNPSAQLFTCSAQALPYPSSSFLLYHHVQFNFYRHR